MKIAIVGGSIAGLATALTLRCVGHEVTIFERTAAGMRGHGGGVAVLRQMMRFLEQHGHATRKTLAVPVEWRRWLASDGSLIEESREIVPFSSWDAVYRSLSEMLPPDVVRYGEAVTNLRNRQGGVEIEINGRETLAADLLIAADGAGSGMRAMLFPDYRASYAGYLAWRGVVEEARLPAPLVAELDNSITLLRERDALFMTFPIPALDGAIEPGKRRFNWLWYRNEPDAATLSRHLTDREGHRHHASVSPGGLSAEATAYLHDCARAGLPPALQQLMTHTQAPFLQAIFDASSPSFAVGRVALVGDAACTVRPHTASGTSKAADDAITLAQALSGLNPADDIEGALAAWSTARRTALGPLIAKGKQLAQSFGLGAITQ
ncbi:2-polyprenyl-6-methoxyphenol hydroxylase-like FAD-dependent oxidoreductase [Paraburkholderia unamae]|uniref:FAD binding domain-containing protein n=1 Tax=Paraburkholderia unamae TaxID=219649 RepID=UPI000DC31176|nr:FAD-dependent monooxygenase [Paraburkholderia unamae]RAR65706.1 2-polyprenyl-6-methoxyphenol hydroxylase-like FAD-dependent oxidoreductase [Paraburkholderia unamae]